MTGHTHPAPLALRLAGLAALALIGITCRDRDPVGPGLPSQAAFAVAPQFAHTGGHYLDDGQEAYVVSDDADLADHPHGVKEWALDAALADRLWALSAELTGSA